MTHARAYGLLFLVTVLWAGNFPASKIGLAELGPLSLAGIRAALLAPVLLVLARLSWAILGEAVHWYHLLGATLVIAGVVLAARR